MLQFLLYRKTWPRSKEMETAQVNRLPSPHSIGFLVVALFSFYLWAAYIPQPPEDVVEAQRSFNGLSDHQKITILDQLPKTNGSAIPLLVAAMTDPNPEIGFHGYEELIKLQNSWILESVESRCRYHSDLVTNLTRIMASSEQVNENWVRDLLGQTNVDLSRGDLEYSIPLRRQVKRLLATLPEPETQNANSTKHLGPEKGIVPRVTLAMNETRSAKLGQQSRTPVLRQVEPSIPTTPSQIRNQQGMSLNRQADRLALFNAAQPIPNMDRSKTIADRSDGDRPRFSETKTSGVTGPLLNTLPFGSQPSLEMYVKNQEETLSAHQLDRTPESHPAGAGDVTTVSYQSKIRLPTTDGRMDETTPSLARQDSLTVFVWLGSDHKVFREKATEELLSRGYKPSDLNMASQFLNGDLEYRLRVVTWVAKSRNANPSFWGPLIFCSANQEFKIAASEILMQSSRVNVISWLENYLDNATDNVFTLDFQSATDRGSPPAAGIQLRKYPAAPSR